MACNAMKNGDVVKVLALKPALRAQLDALVRKDAGKWGEVVNKIKGNIMAGLPAMTDKVGNGPGHGHSFRWQDGTRVPVTEVEYVKLYVQVYVTDQAQS